MILHHLRRSVRAIGKQRVTSVLNIGGLALGIACFLLIGLFVRHELSYDRHHENADRIVRLGLHLFLDGTESNFATVAAPVGPGLKADFPEVVDVVRMQDGSSQIRYEDKAFSEDRFFWADPSIFDVFTLPVLIGNESTALIEPGSVVITESTANKYFGTVDALGEVLQRDGHEDLTVTAVIADIPESSHFKPDFIGTLVGDSDAENTSWLTQNNFSTYFLLTSPAAIAPFTEKLPDVVKERAWPEAEAMFGIPAEQIFAGGVEFDYLVHPLTDIHLKSSLSAEFETGGNITYVWLFAGIALAILLIACINYINLSTAVSERKAREVGVRKAVGSSRRQLIHQFLSDSFVTTFSAVLLGMGVAWMALPVMNTFAERSLVLAPLSDPLIIPGAIVLIVIITLLAGAYPAFVLSSYRPALVLKGSKGGTSKSRLRSGLIVFQYAVSSALVLGALVVYGQLDYIQNKNLGFSGDQVVIVEKSDDIDDIGAFIQQIESLASVQSVSASSHLFGRPSNDNLYTPEGRAESEGKLIWTNITDSDFSDVYQLELVDGRFYSDEMPGDDRSVVINETAVRLLDLENPVGTRLGARFGVGDFTIVGVVKDFHVESFDKAIKPFLFMSRQSNESRWTRRYVSVRVGTDAFTEVLAGIETIWAGVANGQAFEFEFFDRYFEERYLAERQIGQILIAFSFLAIIIAGLGLFGLAAFVTTQRTKEIGIRKSLGATASGIVFMLFRDFGKWIVLANLLAWPLAYWVMNGWLQQFVYRADIALWYFPVSLIAGIALAFLTIGGKTFSAASANPVKALRYE